MAALCDSRAATIGRLPRDAMAMIGNATREFCAEWASIALTPELSSLAPLSSGAQQRLQ
jgi:hypothetical protein